MKAKVKDIFTPYTFQDRTYELRATFNVEAELMDRFGGTVGDAMTGNAAAKNALVIMEILINEAVDWHNEKYPDNPWRYVDAKYIGRHVNDEEGGIQGMMQAITQTMTASRPEINEDELTDEEKNG